MFFILGYGIFRNFGIWDIGIYFGIRVKLILGYGIFWTVYFGIWDIAYPLTKPHNSSLCIDWPIESCKITVFLFDSILSNLNGH